MLLDDEIFNIISLTIRLTVVSTLISSIIGIPLGIMIASKEFFLKKLVVLINRTLMGTPPVVVGLVVFLLLMRNGPLGHFRLLFTFWAMVIAQTILIAPIICGIVYTAVEKSVHEIRAFATTMGATKIQTNLLIIKELSSDIYFAMVTGFGRAMSEVGAIMIVGGNIRYHTRTMTTAISMLNNAGDRDRAIVLGVILMTIAFSVQAIASLLRKEERPNSENL